MGDLDLYILTSNCARTLIDVDLFAAHLFDPLSGQNALTAPDLIVLSLQEIAPIAYSFLGGSYLGPYFDSFVKAVKQATVKQWNESYVNVVRDHTGMTGLMIFARPDAMNKISKIETAHVGFGFNELGNKGAVGARLGYATADHPSKTADLTFVAAHLAPMENALAQRNLDWQSIVERLVFTQENTSPKASPEDQSNSDENTALLDDQDASSHSETSPRHLFAPNSSIFLAGDLNYRTSDTSPTKEDVARFPRRDTTSDDPSHYSHLLKHDQLVREMREGRSFHGLTEAPIQFPPTYKYSSLANEAARVNLTAGSSETEWIWSSHRWPSWCDRILYLDRASQSGERSVKPHVYDALPLFPHSDHRPVALAVSVPLRSGDILSGPETREVAPFAIDPSWRSRRDAARRKEVIVGILAYLGLTWEGNGFLLASTLGIVGAWVVLRSLWVV